MTRQLAPVSPVRPVVCLAGPTGSGKSAAALALAGRFNGVIINADSRQIYRDFPIITAQPSLAERELCPHRLYGFLDTAETLGAGRWADLARQAVNETLAAGKLPILVGGTGFYLRALFDGMADIPPVPPDVRSAVIHDCRRLGLPDRYEALKRVDPVSAARLHPHDRQRILRALEVYEATGKPLSWWHKNAQRPGMPWPVLRFGLAVPLDELKPLLEQRIEAMLRAGAREEAEAALRHCPDPAAPGWSGIGCAELHAFLRGDLDLAGLRAAWLANTRAYAKRQLTWFRSDKRIHWFRPGEHADLELVTEAALRLT